MVALHSLFFKCMVTLSHNNNVHVNKRCRRLGSNVKTRSLGSLVVNVAQSNKLR